MLERGECQDRSTAPVHSRSVRCGELSFQSSTRTFGSTTKLQHIRSELRAKFGDGVTRVVSKTYTKRDCALAERAFVALALTRTAGILDGKPIPECA